VLERVAKPSRPVYVDRRNYVRTMMPEDVVAAERELLADQFGHMVVHNPHRDSWFSHCLNTVNVWIAVGRVAAENGLLLYPEVWEHELERDGTSVARGQPIGVPLTLPLEAGDAVVFAGEHLHSSAINVTNETRYVLSFRLTLGAPRYGDGISWVSYDDLRLVGTRLERLAPARARLTRAYWRRGRRGGGVSD
jgi:ectoine hydroxylase-related dioxygenase (phytanoyl-CoA dioxygenase family)